MDWDSVKEAVMEYGKKEGVHFDPSQHIIPVSSAVSNSEKRKAAVDSIWRRRELASIAENGVERYPKAERFVRSLKKRGIMLAIASNNCHATIEKALAAAGLHGYFDLVVGRDDVRNTKPAPDMLLKISHELKLEENETIFIGDSENDRKAGAAAGIGTIIAKPGSDFPEVES